LTRPVEHHAGRAAGWDGASVWRLVSKPGGRRQAPQGSKPPVIFREAPAGPIKGSPRPKVSPAQLGMPCRADSGSIGAPRVASTYECLSNAAPQPRGGTMHRGLAHPDPRCQAVLNRQEYQESASLHTAITSANCAPMNLGSRHTIVSNPRIDIF
jgi:hypothetical protein